MINVVFFAQLREQLKSDGLSLDIPTPCTVKDVQQALVKSHPEWQVYLSNSALMCAVNQDMVQLNAPVAQGNEVAFFPPVTGG